MGKRAWEGAAGWADTSATQPHLLRDGHEGNQSSVEAQERRSAQLMQRASSLTDCSGVRAALADFQAFVTKAVVSRLPQNGNITSAAGSSSSVQTTFATSAKPQNASVWRVLLIN